MDFNVLEFKFMCTPPWALLSVRICLFLSKLVKASHSPSELRCSVLDHARVHVPSVPSILMGPVLVRVWAVLLFFLTLIGLSLPVVISIFRAELCAIFLALSRILFHNSTNFVIYSDSRSALQALGGLYTHNSLVMKIQCFL